MNKVFYCEVISCYCNEAALVTEMFLLLKLAFVFQPKWCQQTINANPNKVYISV